MRAKLFTFPGIITFGLLGFAITVHAGTWTLANGDRLTGELIAEDAQFIEVQHPQLGRLKVARSALRDTEATPQKSATPPPVAAMLPAEGKKLGVKPEEPAKWKRQIELGYVQQSGAKEKQDLAVRAQIDGREGANTFRASGRVLRSEADNKLVTSRREGDFRWRHDINKKLFAQSLTNYEEDDVRKIDLNLEQQFAGGLRVVDNERHQASVGLGAVVQHLQRQTINDQTAILGSFFQDYSYQLSSRVKWVQESSVMYSDKGALNVKSGVISAPSEGSYRFKFNTGVQSKVSNHLSLNVRFEFDYDRSVLEAALRADQRLSTSLGYLW